MTEILLELLKHLISNSEGQSQLLIIILIFLSYVIKSRKDSYEKTISDSLTSIKSKMNDIRRDNENNFSIVIRTLNETLSGLEGRLESNHVFIVVEIYSTSVKNYLFDVIEEIFYDDELNDQHKEEILERMIRRFETIIHETDQQLYELPDVNPAITSTKEKKSLFIQENIYERLFDIIIKNKDNHYKMKKLVMELLSDTISKWRMR